MRSGNSDDLIVRYRPMNKEDIGRVPVGCQGSEMDLLRRFDDLDSCAILGFNGDQHVAQLQFRRFDSNIISPNGLWDPLYWGEFGEFAPILPRNSLSVFCYHVGQLEDSDARDLRYQGRGIGLALLDYLLQWAGENEFAAIAAKFTPADRKIMSFMGGQPLESYLDRGFKLCSQWVDRQLAEVIQEKDLLSEGSNLSDAATVGCCVRYF